MSPPRRTLDPVPNHLFPIEPLAGGLLGALIGSLMVVLSEAELAHSLAGGIGIFGGLGLTHWFRRMEASGERTPHAERAGIPDG